MKRASITQAKNKLSALIDGLKSGSPVLIVDRGRPVARLEPVVSSADLDHDDRLARLVRDGLVKPARARLTRALLAKTLPRAKRAGSVVAALIEERREGR